MGARGTSAATRRKCAASGRRRNRSFEPVLFRAAIHGETRRSHRRRALHCCTRTAALSVGLDSKRKRGNVVGGHLSGRGCRLWRSRQLAAEEISGGHILPRGSTGVIDVVAQRVAGTLAENWHPSNGRVACPLEQASAVCRGSISSARTRLASCGIDGTLLCGARAEYQRQEQRRSMEGRPHRPADSR